MTNYEWYIQHSLPFEECHNNKQLFSLLKPLMTDDREISRHKLAAQALCNSYDHLSNDAGFQVDCVQPDSLQPW